MKVHHYSVGRSGCTFISQLLVGIFSLENLSAGHTPYSLEPGQPLVISVRDFRDVVLSFWRVQNDISFLDIERGRQATLEEIKPQINLVKLAVANDLNPTFKDNDNILLLKYEEFVPDKFDFIFAEFENFFDISINKKKRKELQLAYSFKRNKYKASKMDSFKKYDKEAIHGLHLHKGEVGGWKSLLLTEHHQSLNDILKQELLDWNYS